MLRDSSGDVKDAETKVHFTVDAAIMRPAAKTNLVRNSF